MLMFSLHLVAVYCPLKLSSRLYVDNENQSVLFLRQMDCLQLVQGVVKQHLSDLDYYRAISGFFG